MFAYIIRRLLQLPLVLLAVSFIIILMMQPLSPEQRAANYLSEQQAARDDVVQATIDRYGFDKPFYVQYGLWLKQAARGDLGYSQESKQPVLRTIRERFPASAELAIYAIIPIIFLSIWLGTQAALRQGQLFDQIVRVLSIIGWSLPTFVFALWLLVIFYGQFNLFGLGRISNDLLLEINRGEIATPTGFYTIDAILNRRWDMLLDFWKHLVLPVTTLLVVICAQLIRVMRSSLLEALSQDYVRTARAKGLAQRVVNLKHARRNALIPVITLSGLMVAGLLNGTVFTEVIFNYRGLGLWFANSAVALDIPAVTGFALLVSVIIVLANLGVDLLYALIDPRIRYD